MDQYLITICAPVSQEVNSSLFIFVILSFTDFESAVNSQLSSHSSKLLYILEYLYCSIAKAKICCESGRPEKRRQTNIRQQCLSSSWYTCKLKNNRIFQTSTELWIATTHLFRRSKTAGRFHKILVGFSKALTSFFTIGTPVGRTDLYDFCPPFTSSANSTYDGTNVFGSNRADLRNFLQPLFIYLIFSSS